MGGQGGKGEQRQQFEHPCLYLQTRTRFGPSVTICPNTVFVITSESDRISATKDVSATLSEHNASEYIENLEQNNPHESQSHWNHIQKTKYFVQLKPWTNYEMYEFTDQTP